MSIDHAELMAEAAGYTSDLEEIIERLETVEYAVGNAVDPAVIGKVIDEVRVITESLAARSKDIERIETALKRAGLMT